MAAVVWLRRIMFLAAGSRDELRHSVRLLPGTKRPTIRGMCEVVAVEEEEGEDEVAGRIQSPTDVAGVFREGLVTAGEEDTARGIMDCLGLVKTDSVGDGISGV